MKQSHLDVLAERNRQQDLDGEGFSDERDDRYVNGELVSAAIAYTYVNGHELLASGAVPASWPSSWLPRWYKPTTRRRDLIKAAALLIAEIDRLDRAALKKAVS